MRLSSLGLEGKGALLMQALSWEATLPFFASLLNGDRLLKKRICSWRSKFFPLRVDPFGRDSSLREATTWSQKKVFCLVYHPVLA